MQRFLLVLAVLWAGFLPAQAQNEPASDTLFQALGLPEVIEVMREEGIGYGAEMQSGLLEGRGGDRWPRIVAEIYAADQMKQVVRDRLREELDGVDLDQMIAFFDSEKGRKIVALEVSARRAMLDKEIESESNRRLADMLSDEDPRLKLVEAFVRAGDLIENNVMGALNSNYAFFMGLTEGGGFPVEMSESEILADVWAQEGAIRADTSEWVFSYLAMAYQPLADQELRDYVQFYETRDGVLLNAAIFAAFDALFVEISHQLGRAASHFMAGEEL